jgi:hypothetical protein
MVDPLEGILANLGAEKQRIEMTEEMARRAGVNKEVALRILAIENVQARHQKRPVDMIAVSKAILFLSAPNHS